MRHVDKGDQTGRTKDDSTSAIKMQIRLESFDEVKDKVLFEASSKDAMCFFLNLRESVMFDMFRPSVPQGFKPSTTLESSEKNRGSAGKISPERMGKNHPKP